jgi:hypothetical protein
MPNLKTSWVVYQVSMRLKNSGTGESYTDPASPEKTSSQIIHSAADILVT